MVFMGTYTARRMDPSWEWHEHRFENERCLHSVHPFWFPY